MSPAKSPAKSPAQAFVTTSKQLKLVSLASTFPNPLQKNLGIFIHARLKAIAETIDVKIVAPVAHLEYGNPARRKFSFGKVPALTVESGMEVRRPRWWYLPNTGPLTPLLLALQLRRCFARLMRTSSYDLIDAHFAYPDGIAAALLSWHFRCPYSITLRGNETDHNVAWLKGWAMRWAIRKADCIIAVSERLRNFAIASGAEPARVKTIPNGIDSSVYYPRENSGIFARFGVPENAPVVLSAGYLIERKGHHKVIEALGTLAQKGCAAHLVIAGGPGAEGVYEPILRGLVSKLKLRDRVHFAGPVSPNDLACLMSASTLFVLASSNEGWPNVLNEAMACGVPVVATDVGAVPEMLPSKEYGFIVPQNDASALAEAIAQALSCSWDRGKIERRGASRSWHQVAGEVISFFDQSLRERRLQ